jgi:hypothetical protein
MMEDKLTKGERLRLEALAQANAANTMGRASAEKILSDARQFLSWLKVGDEND